MGIGSVKSKAGQSGPVHTSRQQPGRLRKALMEGVLALAMAASAAPALTAQEAAADQDADHQQTSSLIDKAMAASDHVQKAIDGNFFLKKYETGINIAGYDLSVRPLGVDVEPFDPNITNLKTTLELGRMTLQRNDEAGGGELSTGVNSDFRLRGVLGNVPPPSKGAVNPQNQNFVGTDVSLFQRWTRPLGRQFTTEQTPFSFHKDWFSADNMKDMMTHGYFTKWKATEGVEYNVLSGKNQPYYSVFIAAGKTIPVQIGRSRLDIEVSVGPKIRGFSGSAARFHPAELDVTVHFGRHH